MSNRRMDAVFFGCLLAVLGVGYLVANRPIEKTDDVAVLAVPNFSLPQLTFEIPFEFPYARIEFERRVAPSLQLSNGMESALGEVRSALLRSSGLREVESREEWVAALE